MPPSALAKGNEDTLIKYWTEGAGAAKIRWGVPGDFDRCVDLVTVEAHGDVPDVKGYCANLHHKALGVWPGGEDKKASMVFAAAVEPSLAPTGLAQVTMPSLVTIPGVDLVAAGEWPLSTGDSTFTTEDLMAAVEASKCPAVGAPVIKLGHVDPRFDGEPAVGRVLNLGLAAQGNKITGDLSGMPGWLGAAMGSAYPNRSIEGCYDYRCQMGHLHPFVLTGLALLGVTPPGVGVLSALGDVASLYGVMAAASTGPTWTLKGAAMSHQAIGGAVAAAGVTTEDVRRAYYAQPGMILTYWITEMQLDPPQLIVCDEATENVYRVPVKIASGGDVTFGDPVQVKVEYADVAAARSSGAVLVYATAAESRAGVVEGAWSASTQIKNLGDDPPASKLKAMFALPGDTKSDSSLPHHDVGTDGAVGAANPDGCSAAIGAINGAQGGLKGVSEDQAKAAYAHLAKHLTDAGKEAPEYSGPGASTSAARKDGDQHDKPQAAGMHDAYTGSHTHAHAANGSQGGDDTHEHEHTHSGDADHGHSHPSAAGPTQERGLKVDFTDEQNKALRAALGLAEDAELTPDGVVTAAAALREQANAKVAAASRAGLPEGTIIVEKEAWDGLNQRVTDGENFRKRQAVKERDTVIAAAIGAGKFSVARRDHWARLWDADPEGTRQVLAGLQKNVVPVGDIGAPGSSDPDDVDEEYSALFGNPNK
jgi:hypothetical protein